MSAIQQVMLAYGATGGGSITDAIYMQYDAGNGTSTFLDQGTAGTTWTRSGSGVVTSTTHIINGVSSLFLPTNADYLEAPTSASNRLPASADFSLKWTGFYPAQLSSAGVGGYLISIQDSGATAAGTQFAIATNSGGFLVIVYSDGTTRSASSAGSLLTANVDNTFEFKRVGTTLTLVQGGVNAVVVTGFSGSFPAAASTKWRIGRPEFGNAGITSGVYFDKLTLTR
jgi:hypothetical protein